MLTIFAVTVCTIMAGLLLLARLQRLHAHRRLCAEVRSYRVRGYGPIPPAEGGIAKSDVRHAAKDWDARRLASAA